MEKDKKMAVLIDGDNIPSKYIKEMMEEIAKYGNPTIKRIYGDWTKPQLSKCNHPYATIRLYNWEKCNRFRHDY
jgi:hypothetical protein